MGTSCPGSAVRLGRKRFVNRDDRNMNRMPAFQQEGGQMLCNFVTWLKQRKRGELALRPIRKAAGWAGAGQARQCD